MSMKEDPDTSNDDAQFIGWQKHTSGTRIPLFNVVAKNHPMRGSTVSAQTLSRLHLQIPELPLEAEFTAMNAADIYQENETTMKALVYHGPGKCAWEFKPMPMIKEPSDAIVKIVKTTICETDLRIIDGDIPEVYPGLILGHEGVGTITHVGSNVSNFTTGDRIIISCITACGECSSCKKGMYSLCEKGGGWVLGRHIDGTQAEYVRIPYADTSLHHIPDAADDEECVMMSDTLPTGFECGVLNGQLRSGLTVAIVGAGATGLATLLTARLYDPAEIFIIDSDEHRLQNARNLGATKLLHRTNGNIPAEVMALTDGKGVDVAVEAVGSPEAFDLCREIAKPGGRITSVSLHGKSIDRMYDESGEGFVTISSRHVDTSTMPVLLKTVAAGILKPKNLISHRFKLDDIVKAYETAANATKENALKVILTN